jgi:Type II site-specific deoxyribonuclease
MEREREHHLRRLYELLRDLTDGQLGWVQTVVERAHKPATFHHAPDADLIKACVPRDFGDAWRIHHGFARGAFTKDRLEYALARVLTRGGIAAALAPRGHPGHDPTIGNARFSLTTQAAKGLSARDLHISKCMELGRGVWTDQEADFIGLREQFFRPREAYDRILSWRRLRRPNTSTWHDERVELPKPLLLDARHGTLCIRHHSTPFPRPACYPGGDSEGRGKCALYFDAGGDRKLQIKGLDKEYCVVHAHRRFETSPSETNSLTP